MRVLIVFAVVLAVGRAFAQPASAIGLPLPASDLPTGTVSVRVIDGSVAVPHPNIVVWLSIDSDVRTAKTDGTGHAMFKGVKVGAVVKVAITEGVMTPAFPIPDKGGVRVVLSTVPMSDAPSLRARSGTPHPDEHAPPGTISVQLAYNDPTNPPAKQPVYLASYAADGTIALITARTDAKGVATFTALDPSGATAYFAMATLPRAGHGDRLAAPPIQLSAEYGATVVLSSERREATTPPLDDIATTQTEKGKLHIALVGAVAPDSQVSVVDAATNKPLATAVTERDVTLAQPSAPVVYIDALVRGEHYRSRPFQPVADRGAELTVYIYPRLLVTFEMTAEADDTGIEVGARFKLQNNSWFPYVATDAIQLPAGARFDAKSIAIDRPLGPGEKIVETSFSLPAGKDGKVHWDLDLPRGTYQSGFGIAKDPGVAITGAPIAAVTKGEFLVLSPITILPKQRMAMILDLAKLSPTESAIARACKPLDPTRKTKLRNQPAPDFTAQGVDGKPFTLSSLRGKAVLVNFTASWAMPSNEELPTMAPLAAALGSQLAIVLVSSDADAKDVKRKPYRTVLDPPVTGNIGPITLSWGTKLLPESYAIDKRGIVRMYVDNERDWGTPAAAACLEAIARE